MAEVEIMQYRDDEGWTCLMYRAYTTKTPKAPCVKVCIHDEASLWTTTMATVQSKIDEWECKKMIAIAKKMKARNVFAERV